MQGRIDSKTKTKRHDYRPRTARVAVSVLESISLDDLAILKHQSSSGLPDPSRSYRQGVRSVYWYQPQQLSPKSFICGYCTNKVASASGYLSRANQFLYLCPHCDKPTFFHGVSQFPGTLPGRPVGHLPLDIAGLYQEARTCAGAGAFTACVLLCRKLLMNIGVQEGAAEGKSFVHYIDFLADKGYIPPNGRSWVDHIRKKGNEATHEIALMSKDDAEELVTFTEMLLKFVYEFPNSVSLPQA
ncbi:DUF4145 domain-containing protein [Pseudomonas putida]|nr:DUF4145 domain-containing protein [Pseudomonas putida]